MGVHDFSAAIYSRENEGAQDLEVPSEAFKPITDPNILVTSAFLGPEPKEENYENKEFYRLDKKMWDENKPIIDEGLQGKAIPDPVGLYREMFDDGPFQGAGTGEAMLEIFIFPKNLQVTNENFDQMVKERKYTKRYFEPYSYRWDGWDFFKGDESVPENWLNYRDSTDFEMTIVWQVKESDDTMDGFRPKILDEYPNQQVWIRNFTKHGYDYYVNADALSPMLDSLDLAYVAYLFGIDYRNKTRSQVFDLIKETINEEFSFETHKQQKKKLVKKTSKYQSKETTPTTFPKTTPKTNLNPKKCLGITKKGIQCIRDPKSGQSYCYQHKQ